MLKQNKCRNALDTELCSDALFVFGIHFGEPHARFQLFRRRFESGRDVNRGWWHFPQRG